MGGVLVGLNIVLRLMCIGYVMSSSLVLYCVLINQCLVLSNM